MSENIEPEEPSLEEIMSTKDKVDKLLRHISNVQEACSVLGKKLIEKGEVNFGVRLIALGQAHDHSKWFGAEFDYLIEGNFNGEAKLAASHHNRSNMHHPEYWGDDIHSMPRIAVAEFVCDISARASEFGTDVREYIKEKAIPRYKISPQGKVYKWIKEFLDLLLDKPFTETPNDE
jgi:hypothetical protein